MNLETRPGTTQAQRSAAAPNPAALRLDERTEADLRAWAVGLAKELRFFDEKNKPVGTWEAFFDFDETALAELHTRAEVPPHYALFLAFLNLFGVAQAHFNGLTKRHLDVYYEKILGLSRREGQPDAVFAVVELAKQAAEAFLPQGTLLDAGKGPDGQPRRLLTTHDAFLNQARVAAQRSYFLQNGTLHTGDTADGRVFGSAALPAVQLGFALASPVLNLTSGDRTVTVECILNQPLLMRRGQLLGLFDGFLSGEKAWMPFSLTPRLEGKRLTLTGTLPAREAAVVGFHDGLEGAFSSEWPVLKLLVPAGAYGFWRQVRVESLSLRVEVVGLTGLEASNDLGPVAPEKAFQPFGPQPVPGSTLYLRVPELETKTLERLTLGLRWLNPPARLGAHYRYYPGYQSLTNASFGASLLVEGARPQPVALFNDRDATEPVTLTWAGREAQADKVRLVNQRHFFHREFPQLYARTLLEKAKDDAAPPAKKKAKAAPASVSSSIKFTESLLPTAEFIQHSLTSVAVDKFVNLAELLDDGIPNEPYTPTLQSLTVGYEASPLPGEVRFFHLDADGFSEQKPAATPLLPQYRDAGQWLIGLEKLTPGQSLSLLVQVADGTADPDSTPPAVTWSVLAGKEWQPLNERELLADETLGLRQSGLVRVNLPDAAFVPHTRLAPELTWLRASVPAGADLAGVCRVVGLHAQALRAVGEKPGAVPTGSATKLAKPLTAVKSLSQPYASAGGRVAEDETAFYRRVSERLRHKGRAGSVWDYEHLVLEAFPELHQVKCLPHTSADCPCPTPGAVTLVLIPRTDPTNPLQPRASQALRQRVADFVNARNPLFAQAEAVNATFEAVEVRAKVRLRPGLPFGFFRDRLSDELKQFLTPWAYGVVGELPFGGSMRRSSLLRFLETRDYVDVVSELRVFLENQEITDTDLLTASGPRAILVSASQHLFESLGV